MLIFWILIGAVMIAAMIAVGIAVVSFLPVGLFYTNIFAGVRFIFGAYIALFFTWGAIYWFFIIVMRAGLAGMFLRLHQGDRPSIGDFGRGITRYIWRFLKGYFHIAILYAIPLLIIGGWIMLRYATYSSLIFESRWNTGLRMDFFSGIRWSLDFAAALIAIMYCFLMVWDESIVLEGSSFSQGFIRSARFAARNIARLLPIAIINYLILRLPGLAAEAYHNAFSLGPQLMRPSGIIGNPTHQTDMMRVALSDASAPLIIFAVMIFILSPIIAYTHYLLYIPNRPFTPGKRLRPSRKQQYVSEYDHPETEVEEELIEEVKPVGDDILRDKGKTWPDVIAESSRKTYDEPVSNKKAVKPEDDFLSLDK